MMKISNFLNRFNCSNSTYKVLKQVQPLGIGRNRHHSVMHHFQTVNSERKGNIFQHFNQIISVVKIQHVDQPTDHQ